MLLLLLQLLCLLLISMRTRKIRTFEPWILINAYCITVRQ